MWDKEIGVYEYTPIRRYARHTSKMPQTFVYIDMLEDLGIKSPRKLKQSGIRDGPRHLNI